MAFPTQSIDFESSSSQYASRSTANALRLKNDFTIEMWLKFESVPTSGNLMWLVQKESEAGRDYAIYAVYLINDSGTLKIRLRTTNGSSASNIDVGVNWTPSTGTWYHLAVTREDGAGAVNFYVDGSQQGTTQTGYVGALHDDADLPFIVAAYKPGTETRYYDGRMTVLRLWSVVQSEATIAANKCVYYGTATTNMVGEWSFDNVYTDASGNGYTLTGTNTPTFGADVPAVCAVVGPANLSSMNGVAKANIASVNGVALANITSINGVS